LVIGSGHPDLSDCSRVGALALIRAHVPTRTRRFRALAGLDDYGYGEAVSKPGSRFERPAEKPFTVTDIAAEDAGDGSSHWCFKVQGLDNTVQAARFATRREAEKAHGRLKRAIELLGHQLPS
jgi:hypothetical protein